MRNAQKRLVGKRAGKRLLGKARRRWVGNIKMDLERVRYERVDWILSFQDLVSTVMNCRVPNMRKIS
jgi:hypothetical protein